MRTRAGLDAGPVLVLVLALIAAWYAAAVFGNWTRAEEALQRAGTTPGLGQIARATLEQARPIVPAPHQVVTEIIKTTVEQPPTSRRSLIYHAGITLASTLAGFGIGTVLGVVLSVLIVHVRTLERSLLPWIIASQTVPILAVAPIFIVVLGSMGVTGVLPKALVSAYLCFFPVAIGMVKGLASPDVLARDLFRTYSASGAQALWRLRLPASMPFLFASLKVAAAISLTGAIVGELPTGAQAGLGARLLAGSYYGQTVQIWAALFMAAALASLLVAAVGLGERLVTRRMGARP